MSDTPDPVDVMVDAISAAFKGHPEWALRTRAEHVLDKLAEAAAITTAEQLDALPTESVVQDRDGNAWTRRPRSWYHPAGPIAGKAPKLPAILLYHPDARHR